MTIRLFAGLASTIWSLVFFYVDVTPAERAAAIRHARVWAPRDVAAYDFNAGEGEIPPWSTVTCDYSPKKLSGASPKFSCVIAPGDDVKVKYGAENGEVYAGVAGTRLLHALGFGADSYYPVHVDCRGCPESLGGTPAGDKVFHFEVAAIERKMKGKSVSVKDKEGWKWEELGTIDAAAGGASPAERDALKLLAVFLQHTDNKFEQQRLLCSGGGGGAGPDAPPCPQSFMMIHDLGNTFGKANKFNRAGISSVNLENWTSQPIWKDQKQCIGNLSKSFTGNLSNPRIGEAGRQFLAELLAQLTDAQLHDLFTVAHFSEGPERMHAPAGSTVNTVDAWIATFKGKRDEIARAHCPTP